MGLSDLITTIQSSFSLSVLQHCDPVILSRLLYGVATLMSVTSWSSLSYRKTNQRWFGSQPEQQQSPIMLADEERRSSEMFCWAEEHCIPSCERQMTVEEEEVGGSCDDERIGTGGGGSSARFYRSKSYSALQQSPLPMATTPPLSPELLQRGEARCKADFSRSNTWDRISAAGLYAVSLWKLSQEMIEEKAKVLTEGPVGKLKNDREQHHLVDIDGGLIDHLTRWQSDAQVFVCICNI